MRNRALLLIPALATATLAVGVSSATAATLFLTNNHAGGRVTLGATATATSVGPVDITGSGGTLINRCSDVVLHFRVVENAVARSSLDVYSSSFNTCDPVQKSGTHTPPWRLTVTGTGTMIGDRTSYAGTLHNLVFDIASVPGVFTSTVEEHTTTANTTTTTQTTTTMTNLTVTQSTTTTNGLCVDINNSGPVVNAVVGIAATIDAKFCLTSHPASTWSLT